MRPWGNIFGKLGRKWLTEVELDAVMRLEANQLYMRLKAAKGGNVGKVAVARQMLEDGWTMLMKQEPFRFVPKQAGSLARRG